MQEQTDKYLERIREIVLTEIGDRPVRVYLFGSRAEGSAAPGSDVDIALEAHGPVERGLLFRIRDALEESTVPYKVDVVDLALTSEEFRQRVRARGVLWKDWN